MIYKAIYAGPAAYAAALDVAAGWAESDGYYRSPAGYLKIGDARCGCTGVDAAGRATLPEPDNIGGQARVQWLACSGNLARVTFDHAEKTAVLFISSSRHGLPQGVRELARFEPARVLTYETRQAGWPWWVTADQVLLHGSPAAAGRWYCEVCLRD